MTTEEKSDDLVSDLNAIDASLSLKLDSLADAENRLHNLHNKQAALREQDEQITALLVHAEAELSAGISSLHDKTVILRCRTREADQAAGGYSGRQNRTARTVARPLEQ